MAALSRGCKPRIAHAVRAKNKRKCERQVYVKLHPGGNLRLLFYYNNDCLLRLIAAIYRMAELQSYLQNI